MNRTDGVRWLSDSERLKMMKFALTGCGQSCGDYWCLQCHCYAGGGVDWAVVDPDRSRMGTVPISP